MIEMKNLPLGINTLSAIRGEDMVYLDKTEIAWQILKTTSRYFLLRPRRFGKTLFLDILREIFEGQLVQRDQSAHGHHGQQKVLLSLLLHPRKSGKGVLRTFERGGLAERLGFNVGKPTPSFRAELALDPEPIRWSRLMG